MAACCYFGADLRNWLDHNFPSRLTDWTSRSSSDLLYSSLLLPFTWKNYSKSNPLLPFILLDKIIPNPIPLLSSLRTKIFSRKSLFFLLFPDEKISVQLQIEKNYCKSNCFLLLTLLLLTHSILLPRESKQCPLTLASILACADSADELRFWSMSGS